MFEKQLRLRTYIFIHHSNCEAKDVKDSSHLRNDSKVLFFGSVEVNIVVTELQEK